MQYLLESSGKLLNAKHVLHVIIAEGFAIQHRLSKGDTCVKELCIQGTKFVISINSLDCHNPFQGNSGKHKVFWGADPGDQVLPPALLEALLQPF